MQIEMDEEREKLILTTNKPFQIMNENHLYEALGLTQVEEQELEEFFNMDINNFLKTTQVIGSHREII